MYQKSVPKSAIKNGNGMEMKMASGLSEVAETCNAGDCLAKTFLTFGIWLQTGQIFLINLGFYLVMSDWDFSYNWLYIQMCFICTTRSVNFTGNIILFMDGMSCIDFYASIFSKFLILNFLDLKCIFLLTVDIFACSHIEWQIAF